MLIKQCADLIIQALKCVQLSTEQIVINFHKDGIWLKIKKKLLQIKKLNNQNKMEHTVTQMTEWIAILTISLNAILQMAIIAQQVIKFVCHKVHIAFQKTI